jgi:hypothetical protein
LEGEVLAAGAMTTTRQASHAKVTVTCRWLFAVITSRSNLVQARLIARVSPASLRSTTTDQSQTRCDRMAMSAAARAGSAANRRAQEEGEAHAGRVSAEDAAREAAGRQRRAPTDLRPPTPLEVGLLVLALEHETLCLQLACWSPRRPCSSWVSPTPAPRVAAWRIRPPGGEGRLPHLAQEHRLFSMLLGSLAKSAIHRVYTTLSASHFSGLYRFREAHAWSWQAIGWQYFSALLRASPICLFLSSASGPSAAAPRPIALCSNQSGRI